MVNKQITLKTKPHRIIEQFKEVFAKGGSINLKTKDGFIYAVGGMLCKIEDGKEFFYNRELKMWVSLW